MIPGNFAQRRRRNGKGPRGEREEERGGVGRGTSALRPVADSLLSLVSESRFDSAAGGAEGMFAWIPDCCRTTRLLSVCGFARLLFLLLQPGQLAPCV
jgi:hypothetical protein